MKAKNVQVYVRMLQYNINTRIEMPFYHNVTGSEQMARFILYERIW